MKNKLLLIISILISMVVNSNGQAGWKLTGNTGTNPLNNFIGTNDSISFTIRTHNQPRVTFTANGNAGLGTTAPSTSAILELKSTTQGFLLPRMTKVQRNAISAPVAGLLIYQSNNQPGFYYYNGTSWTSLTGMSANTALSNLSPTSINQSLIPSTDGILELGSTTLRWNNIFSNNITFGNGTIQSTAFIPYVAGSGISIVGNTIINTADTTSTGANTSLSNLVTTSINQDLVANTNNLRNLGSSQKRWKNIYFDQAIYLHNQRFIYDGGTSNGCTFIGETQNTNNLAFSNTFVGYQAGKVNSDGFSNVFIGTAGISNTSGSGNVFIGDNCGYANTTAYYNCFVGYKSGKATTTGALNAFFGYSAGEFNTTGNNNVFIGGQAGFSNTAGELNTFIGTAAGYSNTEGVENICIGFNSGLSTTDGSENVFIGDYSGQLNTSGANTAVGNDAMLNNTDGGWNTAFGAGALSVTTTGYNNIALGGVADVSTGTIHDATAIGYAAIVNTSNKMRFGNSSVTVIEGTVAYTVSDGRFKNHITEEVKGLDFINKLRPVVYNFEAGKFDQFLMKNLSEEERKKRTGHLDYSPAEKIRYSGFIAQEVEQAAKETGYDFNGVHVPESEDDNYSLAYAEFVVPLVKAVQELSESNDQLNSKLEKTITHVDQVETRNAELETEIQQLQSAVASLQKQTGDRESFNNNQQLSGNYENEAVLGQNIPNPFDNTTIIPFRISKNCTGASIMIAETGSAKIISIFPISCDETNLVFHADNLPSGTYSYSLYINGKQVDEKKLMITR